MERARQQARAEDPPCSNSFQTVWGLPCEHVLRQLLVEGKQLELHHFDDHWYLQQNDALLPAQVEQPEATLPTVLENVTANFTQLPTHQQQAMVEDLNRLSQQAPQPLREPDVSRTKGRPTNADAARRRNDSSTRRDPSGFEYVDPIQRRRQIEKCGGCGEHGHRSNSKHCPLKAANINIPSAQCASDTVTTLMPRFP